MSHLPATVGDGRLDRSRGRRATRRTAGAATARADRGARPGAGAGRRLLGELRALVREAEAWARVEGDARARATRSRETSRGGGRNELTPTRMKPRTMAVARLLPRPASAAPGRTSKAPPRTQVIALANQKGGVAKTTTTLNLGVALREQGLRVLLHRPRPAGEPDDVAGPEPGHDRALDVRRARAPAADRAGDRRRARSTSPSPRSTSPAPSWRCRARSAASARSRRRSRRSRIATTTSSSTRRRRSAC